MDSNDYADYFADKWSASCVTSASTPAYAKGTFAFHDWVRDSLLTNKPYDQFVREVITASGDIDENPAVAWYRQVKDPTAQLEDVGQLFLGMRMRCGSAITIHSSDGASRTITALPRSSPIRRSSRARPARKPSTIAAAPRRG